MSPVWSEQAPGVVRDVIALDGPSGTGKSTVARGLARRLSFRYLDTGAMYRAVTWVVLREGVDPEDASAVTDLAARTRITVTTDPDDQHVTVDGKLVDREIRSKAVTTAVSPVSAAPGVRVLLVAAQRELIGDGAIVVEGRDIGTVVAPDAPLKIFLTASLRRARHPPLPAGRHRPQRYGGRSRPAGHVRQQPRAQPAAGRRRRGPCRHDDHGGRRSDPAPCRFGEGTRNRPGRRPPRHVTHLRLDRTSGAASGRLVVCSAGVDPDHGDRRDPGRRRGPAGR